MAVLAVTICSHVGKALVSRQFKELSKDRITELLANFASLLSRLGLQNTAVEDESVRYVYQPLEEYYVVLLTNKQLNILQDIDTLHLFVSVVSNMLRSVDEKEIFSNAFEILSAFDEIVNLGYREKLTMSQVQSFLEMDSHEEKIQEIIERNKEMEATEERRRRAKEIQRKELARRNMELQQAAVFGTQNASSVKAQDRYEYNTAPSLGPAYGNGGRSQVEYVEKEYCAPRPVAGKGLQLGKKAAKSGTLEQKQPLLAGQLSSTAGSQFAPHSQPHVLSQASTTQPRAVSSSALPSPDQNMASRPQNDGILIILNEKISAQLTRDGGITSSEVKGDLNLRINDAALARAKILLDIKEHAGVLYKTHPNVDRNLFMSANCIGLKDKGKPFPSNDQSLSVLRWKAAARAEDPSLVPFLLNAWVTWNDGVADVTLECDPTQAYRDAHPNGIEAYDVRIVVPVVSEEVVMKSDSSLAYEITDEGIVFTIADASTPLSVVEFSVPVESEDSLFPMPISFNITHTSGQTEATGSCGKVLVVDVVSNFDDEESLPFDFYQYLSSESYVLN